MLDTSHAITSSPSPIGTISASLIWGMALITARCKFKLCCLIFDKISLPDSPKKIMGMLDISRLEVLSFQGCRNSGPLIRSMAEELRRVPNKLRVFRHMREAYKGPLNHIQSLLDSTTKMTEISINAMQAHPLPIACIARHGSSLKSLQLSFWHRLSELTGDMRDSGYSTQRSMSSLQLAPAWNSSDLA